MTNPSTSQESHSYAGCPAAGAIHVAKADLLMTLSNGDEVMCSLEDGKTTLIQRDSSGPIFETFQHFSNFERKFPQGVQGIKGKLLNVLDVNGQDLPIQSGLSARGPNLPLLQDKDQASSLVQKTDDQLDSTVRPLTGYFERATPASSFARRTDDQLDITVGPLTGYFERATPVGSQRPETEQSFLIEDDQDSLSLTEEANNLNLAGPGNEGYFQPATPVPSSQRERLSSFWENQATYIPDVQERTESTYPSSFDFKSSVTETEQSLERDIAIDLLWGEPIDFEERPEEIPDD